VAVAMAQRKARNIVEIFENEKQNWIELHEARD